MTDIDDLQDQITQLTSGFKSMADLLSKVAIREEQVAKQLEDLRIEVEAIKQCR